MKHFFPLKPKKALDLTAVKMKTRIKSFLVISSQSFFSERKKEKKLRTFCINSSIRKINRFVKMSEVFEGKNMRKTFVAPALVEENWWCSFIAQQLKWTP